MRLTFLHISLLKTRFLLVAWTKVVQFSYAVSFTAILVARPFRTGAINFNIPLTVFSTVKSKLVCPVAEFGPNNMKKLGSKQQKIA